MYENQKQSVGGTAAGKLKNKANRNQLKMAGIKHKKSTKETTKEVKPAVLKQAIKLSSVDGELDNLFKSSTFPPLETVAVPEISPPEPKESPTTKSAPQTTKPAPQITKSPEPKNKQAKPVKENTLPEKLKKNKEPSRRKPKNTSIETSYETKLAIERAKLFAQQLKQSAVQPSTKQANSAPSKPPQKTQQIEAHTDDKDDGDDNNEDEDDDSGDDNDDDTNENQDEDPQGSMHSNESEGGDSYPSEDPEDDKQSLDTPLVHETALARSSSTSKSKTRNPKKKDLPDETSEQKNARTVFIGNVHIDCVKNKSASRALQEHLLRPVESENQVRIESIRYRGIPLATPIGSEPPKEQHGAKRSKAWQEAQAGSRPTFDDAAGGSAGRRGAKAAESSETSLPTVKFLTGGQKRMIGYVTGDIHPEAKSCLAYAVIAPPLADAQGTTTKTAAELAKLIATKNDGTSFMDRVLRCDIAFQSPSKTTKNTTSNNPAHSIDYKEQRRTLFIGGLDFVEEEDSIRKAVEKRILEEKKGSLPDGANTWVERVRVIRDKATSLTKGFAYVLLRTQDAVEEMLALPEGSFKIGKRKVRLQKYLSTGQSSALKRTRESTSTNSKQDKKSKLNHQTDPNSSSKTGTQKPKTHNKPRIDLSKEISTDYKGPDQSKELATMDKDQRKRIKSANQLRVERRMLKKTNQLKIKILSTRKSSNSHSSKSEFHNTLKPFKSAIKKLDASKQHKKLKSEKQKGITSSNNNKKPKSVSK
ncbi:hypothetical protein MJO29_006371 [Puccinia striiformis f. sp. tritici]|nr:hypothetical protein MJO29_006371 [Puccinia striiformis f. sp. tritici]